MRPTPQKLLSTAGTEALLVSDLTNIRYLTGLQLSAGVLLVLPRKYTLFVDARYREGAERSAYGFDVEYIARIPDIMKRVGECGIEAEHVTIVRLLGWKRKFKNTKFVRTYGAVEQFRRQKSEDELKTLKRARRMTQELLRRVPSVLRKAVTEEQLARQLLIWSLEMGADGLSFDAIVGFGTHTSSPHHRPTSRTLKQGDVVQIDVGVKYRGYCADMSEVYFTAEPTREQRRVYDALCEAKDAATDAVQAGVTNHELDRIARAVLKREGIDEYFTHALGHGVGLDIHEGASISGRSAKQEILKNEVITIEPGVYFPGKWGMRVEDMVFVH